MPDLKPLKSISNKFEKLLEAQKKGRLDMSNEENMIIINKTFAFRDKGYGKMEIPFTREEVLDESKGPERDRLIQASIELAKKVMTDFDASMKVYDGLVNPSPLKTRTDGTLMAPAQAEGDDEACPTCGSKMTWINRKSKKAPFKPWSAWSCPKTHPSIPEADRCTQKLVFPDKK